MSVNLLDMSVKPELLFEKVLPHLYHFSQIISVTETSETMKSNTVKSDIIH